MHKDRSRFVTVQATPSNSLSRRSLQEAGVQLRAAIGSADLNAVNINSGNSNTF